MALSTLPELSRVAMPLASAGNEGRSLSQPVGQFTALHLVQFCGKFRVLLSVVVKQLAPLLPQFVTALADAKLKMFEHAIRNQEVWHLPASRNSSLPGALLFRLTAHHGLRWYPVCPAIRSRCDYSPRSSVGRSFVCRKLLYAFASASRSLASVTWVTFQP